MIGALTAYLKKSKILLSIGNALKNIVPYMWIYKLFAWILMPKSNHKKSSHIFIKGAKKVGKENFLAWFNLVVMYEKNYLLKN